MRIHEIMVIGDLGEVKGEIIRVVRAQGRRSVSTMSSRWAGALGR